jgi:hypothetical protein
LAVLVSNEFPKESPKSYATPIRSFVPGALDSTIALFHRGFTPRSV